jgi:Tfp pilus assembly protein PilF
MSFYITRAYMYSRHLINDEEMYRENWRNHPNSDYAINNLSYFLIQQQRFDEARVVIMRGLAIDKTNKMLWYNLGVSWAAQGHFNNDEGKFRFLRALDCWKTALQIEPRWNRPAEDLKKLVKILVENKVLTLDQKEAADPTKGMTITLPNIIGLPT